MAQKWKNYDEIKSILSKIDLYNSIVVYDVETTGLNKNKDKIIQFSAIRYSLPEWKELDRIDIYIKPPFNINGSKASEMNGITDEMLDELGLSEDEAFLLITMFMKENDLIAGYNNNSFDDKMMESLYANHNKIFNYNDSIDVYRFVKLVVPPEAVTVKVEKKTNGATGKNVVEEKTSYKLETVTNYYDPENTTKFHSSIEDVEATSMVFAMSLADAFIMINEAEEEENKRKAVPRQDAKVLYINLFNPSKNLKRVYVQTDQGTVYYDEVKHEWRAKTGSVDSINMSGVISQVLMNYNIDNECQLFNAAVQMDKISKAKALLGVKSSCVTEKELNETYLNLVNDYAVKSTDIKEDVKEQHLKELKSAYNTLKKNYLEAKN